MLGMAQHDLYLGGQIDAGVMSKNQIDGNRLKQNFVSPHFGGNLFLSYRMFDVVSFEFGLGQHWNNVRYEDDVFERNNEGFSSKLKHENFYWTSYAAISAMYKIGNTDTYIYGKLAYSNNVYGKQTLNSNNTFVISQSNINQSLSSQIDYVASNQSLIPEIGIEQKLINQDLLAVGIKMNIGNSEVFSGNYTVTDHVAANSISNNFSSFGDYFSLCFRYNIQLYHVPKKERFKRFEKKEAKIVIPPILPDPRKDTIIEEPKDTIIVAEPPNTDNLANRKLIITKKMKVHSSKVKVMIWDHQTVDGDRVSLNLNGKWVLENYTLEKEKYTIELELQEGVNIFVLHALNLGKYEPNTAALMVDDGEKTHRVILISDMSESGTLQLNYKKKTP